MSEKIEKLRMAIIGQSVWAHPLACDCAPCRETDAALAAVEPELAALQAERDELRKDKKRLDWLDMNCVTHLPEQRGAPATDSWCFMSRPAPLREAIDIALYAEKAAP